MLKKEKKIKRKHRSETCGLLLNFFIFSAFFHSGCGSEFDTGPGQKTGRSQLERQIPHPFVPFSPMDSWGQIQTSPRVSQALFHANGTLSLLGGNGDHLADGLFFGGHRELADLVGYDFSWRLMGHFSAAQPGQHAERLQLIYDGRPVVSSSAVVGMQDDEIVWMNASLPDWTSEALLRGSAVLKSPTPFSYSADEALTLYSLQKGFDKETFQQIEEIYFPGDFQLHAAYQFRVPASKDGKDPHWPLHVIVDADNGRILSETVLALHVDGTARIFRENNVASFSEGLSRVSLPDLQSDGSLLRHSLFRVLTCGGGIVDSNRCGYSAQSESGDFTSIQYEDPRYDELVAYFAVTRAMSWFRGLMVAGNGDFLDEKSWSSLRSDFGLSSAPQNRLTIYVRTQTVMPTGESTPDNAVYLPSGSTGVSAPEILIGTGWEDDGRQSIPRELQYLGKDADVTMHEFGHHIVFRAVTEVRGESLAMHEGFADYFTYAVTGNSSLAESVVSIGVPLRSATQPGTLKSYSLATTPPHKAGEFWSTVLWDIRSTMGPWTDSFHKMDKIVWHAIDYMKSNEGYYGAIAAMARAAEDFAAATGDDAILLKEQIFGHFHARGFLQTPSGDGVLPKASSLVNQTALTPQSAGEGSGASATKSRSSSRRGFFGLSCTIAQTPHQGVSTHLDIGTLLLLLLMGAAPFSVMRHRSATVRIRIRARKSRND